MAFTTGLAEEEEYGADGPAQQRCPSVPMVVPTVTNTFISPFGSPHGAQDRECRGSWRGPA
jgi:hypothetical protein